MPRCFALLLFIAASLLSACGGAQRLPIDVRVGQPLQPAAVFAACETFPTSPELVHVECDGGVTLTAVRLELRATEAGLREGLAAQTDDRAGWQGTSISCTGRTCTRAATAAPAHAEQAIAISAPHLVGGVFVAVCSAPADQLSRCASLVDGLQRRERVPAADVKPAAVDFMGRALRLHRSCRRLGKQHLKCEQAGEMDWQVHPNMSAAETTVAARRAEMVRRADAAGGHEGSVDLPCTLGGVLTTCVRAAHNILPAPARWFDDRPLIVVSAAAEVRGKSVVAVCSFWQWQAPPKGMAALCGEVFDLSP